MVGTLTINAAAIGFQGDAAYGGAWGYPLEYVHQPNDDTIKYQDTWSGSMSGAFFTLQGRTDFAFAKSDFDFSMQVSSATFYKPTETIDGKPQSAIKIGTATFDPFSWSGSGGYSYGSDGSISGYKAYIQDTSSGSTPGGTPLAGNAFGGHIASMDLRFNGSNVDDYINGGNLSGIGHSAFFYGNDGNDLIHGSYFANNEIYGGSGSDHIQINSLYESDVPARSQLLDGGDGDDYISADSYTFDSILLLGGAGKDTIIAGGNGQITIEGGYGNDSITKNSTENDVTVVYSGQSTDYVVTDIDGKNGYYEIVDIRSGSVDGRDAVNRADHLSFSDGDFAFDAIATNKRAIAGSDQVDILTPSNYEGEGQRYVYDNIIYAHGGNDYIDGGYGADTMIGGLGNDTYVVDDANDLIVELLKEGTDTVISSVNFTLASNVENLTLSGNADLSGTGNSLANTIIGNTGANVLSGLAGNDTYFVDNAADQVIEASQQGTDTVVTTVSYKIAAGQSVETLKISATTGKANLDITGNEFTNTLIGNDGNNTLDGGAGADVMSGGAGNDTYLVDARTDLVKETAGQGSDTIISTSSFVLAAGQSVETLKFATSTGDTALNLMGNELANTLIGNAGTNYLYGKAGNDVLNGLGGNDFLFGEAGQDTFSFTTSPGAGNVDHIVDFAAVDDTIRLSKSIFAGLSLGELGQDAFKVISSSAVDADDRILYNKTTGALFYDADGSGAKAAVQFATLDNKATIDHHDFFIV